MKLCRYDDDKLGVVIGDMVHDVTQAQTEIRNSTPYTAKVDPVVAALPKWRDKLEQMAKAAPGKPISQVKLLSPVAKPPKIMAAPTNYGKHIEEMQKFRDTIPGLARFSPDIEKAGIFLKSNTSLVGPSEGIPMRFPDRRNDHEAELVLIIGKQGSDIPKEKAWDYIAGYSLGFDMTARGQEDRSFRKSIDGYTVLGPWMITADELPNPADVPFTLHVNDEKRQDKHELPDLRHPEADRIRLEILHALSRRPLLHRHPGGRRPGQAGRLGQDELAAAAWRAQDPGAGAPDMTGACP